MKRLLMCTGAAVGFIFGSRVVYEQVQARVSPRDPQRGSRAKERAVHFTDPVAAPTSNKTAGVSEAALSEQKRTRNDWKSCGTSKSIPTHTASRN
jgi:hypothetical protein